MTPDDIQLHRLEVDISEGRKLYLYTFTIDGEEILHEEDQDESANDHPAT